MVNREWRCTFHDHEFEALTGDGERPPCPYGCHPDLVVLEFRTPPGMRGRDTRMHDALQRQLASDYNMSDMRGDKDGTSIMSNTRLQSGGARQVGDKGTPYWRSDYEVKPGWTQRGESDPVHKPPASWTCAATPIDKIQQGARTHLATATRFVGPKGYPGVGS
jgi:hypothetical protein